MTKGVPKGAWLLTRPSDRPKEFQVTIYRTEAPTKVIGAYEVGSGKLLRDETPRPPPPK